MKRARDTPKKIRIKHSKGTKVLSFTGPTELGLLKAVIEEETGIPAFNQKRTFPLLFIILNIISFFNM